MLYYACIIIIVIIVILLYKKVEHFTEETTEEISKSLTTKTTEEIIRQLPYVYNADILKVRNIQANNFYPVGSVYLSQLDIKNPATILGFGTWIQLSGGYLYLDTSPNTSIRGSNIITATNLMPHAHEVTFEANWNKGRQASNDVPFLGKPSPVNEASSWGARTATTTPGGGVSNPTEFRPKYVTLCAWYRTA